MSESTPKHDPGQGDEIPLPDGSIMVVDVLTQPDDPATGVMISIYGSEDDATNTRIAILPSVKQWDQAAGDILKVVRAALVARSRT